MSKKNSNHFFTPNKVDNIYLNLSWKSYTEIGLPFQPIINTDYNYPQLNTALPNFYFHRDGLLLNSAPLNDSGGRTAARWDLIVAY